MEIFLLGKSVRKAYQMRGFQGICDSFAQYKNGEKAKLGVAASKKSDKKSTRVVVSQSTKFEKR